MVEEWETINEGKNLKLILIIVIAIIGIISIATLTLSATWAEPTQNQTTPYATTYNSITPQDAYSLVYNNSHPLTIIDVRNCDCDYEAGHIPGAIWQLNPKTFYDSTTDLLVYCQDGIEFSLSYCEKLVGHTYGAIYCLEGGIDAWENAGYRVSKV